MENVALITEFIGAVSKKAVEIAQRWLEKENQDGT
jgi:hypothetical protein